MKAGKVQSGEFASERAIQTGHAACTFVATNASNNTKKLFYNKCEFYKVPIYEEFTKEELGQILGKQIRTSLVITDSGFAKQFAIKIAQVRNQQEDSTTISQKDGGSN